MRATFRVALMAAALAACAKGDQPPADFETPAAPAAPMPSRFTVGDFGRLRWLEGTWRGTMSNGSLFHESYRFVNDSTIARGTHTDSTFRTKTDSSLIVFRGGAIIDSSSAVYTAGSLDSNSVDFLANADPKYHYTWTREGPDAWTARIFSNAPDGTERVAIYPMKRFRP